MIVNLFTTIFCLASVVVTPTLDWKLHAFDVLSEFDGSNETSYGQMLVWNRETKYSAHKLSYFMFSNMHGLLDHNTNQWSWQNQTGMQLRSLLHGPLIPGAWREKKNLQDLKKYLEVSRDHCPPQTTITKPEAIDLIRLKECYFAKLQVGRLYNSVTSHWSSREEEEKEISKSLRHNASKKADSDCRVATWEQEEKTKSCLRYQREEAKIQAWLDLHSAKVEAQSRKLEVFSLTSQVSEMKAMMTLLLQNH